MAEEMRENRLLPKSTSPRIAEWQSMREKWSAHEMLHGDVAYVVKSQAPFSEWVQMRAFDSASECEAMKSRLRSHAENVLGRWGKMQDQSLTFGDAIAARRMTVSRCSPLPAAS
jgi:hypothetical protein